MTPKSPRLRAIYRTFLVGDAVALPLLFYALGFPTVGAALLLSSMLLLTRPRSFKQRSPLLQPASEEAKVLSHACWDRTGSRNPLEPK